MKSIVEINKILINGGFSVGRMISFSKSSYMKLNPDNKVVFNANIVTEEHGKIWHGDLDLTRDCELLIAISEEIGIELYVLREMDCRFETENDNVEILINKAVWSTKK